MTQRHLVDAIWLHSDKAKMCGVVQHMQVMKQPDMQDHMRSPRSVDRQRESEAIFCVYMLTLVQCQSAPTLLWQQSWSVRIKLQAELKVCPAGSLSHSKTGCGQDWAWHVSNALRTML